MKAVPIDLVPPLSPNTSIGGAILSHDVKEVANISAGAVVLESLRIQGVGYAYAVPCLRIGGDNLLWKNHSTISAQELRSGRSS